ncbi:dihydrofolate reductase family protein [Microbacterium hominis]|uniref:Deaminase n=1 Tax=Microbacterium hominis TaxID=162426 RepID=A0A0B4CYA7_9MICO|nr:dihydrofolate reductase family protein [Microbacterium hominis]KIC57045.1 deaminase [Microbacterium hominis]
MRGRIVIDLFTTLDGVAQAPGGPDEDISGGFPFGGWQAPFEDAVIGEDVGSGIRRMDALLLGRRTYDIFAGYWPHHTDGPEGFIGRHFDAIPKYVASRAGVAPEWAGTSVLTGSDAEVAAAVDALRDRHAEVHVIGSVDFSQTLLRARLYDELKLWVHPVVLGQGKKVFPDGAAPARLRLIAPAVSGPTGTLLLRYAPDGDVVTGDMT